MSINRKIILLVVGITILIFLVMFFVSNYFYLRGFEDLETKTVQQNVQQVSDALAVSLGSLDSFCVDWAEWDDTYYYAQNLSEDYVNLNLTDDTFTNSDINIFLVLKYFPKREKDGTWLYSGGSHLIK